MGRTRKEQAARLLIGIANDQEKLAADIEQFLLEKKLRKKEFLARKRMKRKPDPDSAEKQRRKTYINRRQVEDVLSKVY